MSKRNSSQRGGFISWVLRHAKDLIGVAVLIGLLWGIPSYFATAADVEKKFNALAADVKVKYDSLKLEIKANGLETRKAKIDDELYRLRDERNPKNEAQIKRFEAELLDISAKLRDMAKQRE